MNGSSRLKPGVLALALISYVPLLLTHRGKVGADTKSYLYIDPAKLLSKAPFLWDPSVGLGTVTHQNIGYLFPMGPFYWLAETIGLPDWVAQRIWMGSIIFLAGLGVMSLLRTLRWTGPGTTVAAFAYALSPYLLHYIYKHSVLLLPFAALPWLIALTAKSLRHPGWKHPAIFALIVLAAGGVNATSLLLVLIGPAMWIVHAVFVDRELPLRAVIAPCLRITVLTVITSLWWVAGLVLQGRYGIDVLRFTETYRTVSNASSASEVTRSLGYWFFYGIDTLGPWFRAANTYTQSLPVLALSFAVPLVCVVSGLFTRFRYRVFFVGLTVAGVIVSVGAHPWKSPSPYGSVFKAFTATASGLAMRSTPRAVPLFALGLAVMLAAGVSALGVRFPDRKLVLSSAAVLMCIANLSPLVQGRMLDEFLERPEALPTYWNDAAAAIDSGNRSTRVLEVPGIEFANYRWGKTVDPITPGMIDRDYAARELVPYGSAASADLMAAIDMPLQNARLDPVGYAQVLRLMGVGDLVLRSDLEYERFRTPRPRRAASWMSSVIGLGDPATFGARTPNRAPATSPLLDDQELATPLELSDPAPVQIYPVNDPLAIVRSVPTATPTVISGDGIGIVETANAGLLDPERLVEYSGSVTGTAKQLDERLNAGARLIVTDTNRKAGLRWGATKSIHGYTETADETAPADPSDNRLDLFGRDSTEVQTVAVLDGPIAATASSYGNSLSFTPGDRAAKAVDGDVTTAWRTAAFSDARGEWLQLRSTKGPIEPHSLALRQVEGSNRWITKIRLTFDGHRSREVALDESSHTEGTTIDLGDERFSTLRITILETDPGEAASYKPFSTVGFSEAHLGTLAPTTEWIRPPRDLITAVGERSASHELAYVFERQASSPDSGAADEEDRLLRIVDVPTARAFTPQVKVRLNPNAPDNQLDSLLGIGGVSATASSGLRYDSWWRASKVLDDEDTTGWTSALEPTMPQWVDFALPAPVTTEARSITVLADGRHSVPTAIHFEVDGVEQPRITLPTVADGPENHREILSFDPVVLTGTHIRLVIDAIREVRTPEWFSGNPSLAPVTVTNLDAATLHESRTEAPPALDCRNDLISMDSVPVPLRIQQSTAEQWRGLEMGAPLTAAPCEATSTLALSAGEHRLSTPHVTDGVLAVDAARLTSPAGAAGPEASAPKLAVTRDSRTSYMIRPKSNAAAPYWLVLGQSFNDGWSLEANGRDLGPPQLVNGYANGWRIDPADVGDATIRLRWKPQSFVWLALGLSGVGFVLCCALALRRPRASTRTIPRPTVVRLISPFDAFGQPPSLISGLGAVAAAAFVGGFFLGPLWAPVIGAAIAAALWTNTGWRALRLGVIAGLVLGAAYVVVQQWRVRYSLDFDWPAHFDRVHWLVMACYVLLACETLVEALRAGWRRDANFEE